MKKPPVNPFADLFENDGYLAALLRVYNEPEFRHVDAWPFLDGLENAGYVKNTRKYYEPGKVPWWSVTPKGRAVTRAFAMARGEEKEQFLRRTYRMFR